MTILNVENLSKHYTTYKRGSGFAENIKNLFKREKVLVKAVDDISFKIEQGTVCGILGPNGAGKSTTIKMLCGALFPTSGQIDVLGFNPAKQRTKYVRHIGAVFGQRSQLIFDIPPIDSFAMNKSIYGISNNDYKARLKKLVELFEIEEVIHKPTRVLSLGERMKCEFVMTMLHNPEIVFLDEPTIGLDVLAKTKIHEVVNEMNKDGTTFILTTHDLGDVEQLAKQVIIINHGKKVFDSTLKNLKTTLGEHKIVSLSLAKPYTKNKLCNVPVIKKENGCKIDLELDLQKQSINEFLNILQNQIQFTDISINELPMEMIITKIYEN